MGVGRQIRFRYLHKGIVKGAISFGATRSFQWTWGANILWYTRGGVLVNYGTNVHLHN